MFPGVSRHRERRVEELRLADASPAHQVDHRQVQLVEVQPIRDHQLDAADRARLDHLLALGHGDRHRLLAQHVDAGVGRSHGVFRVHRVRQRDVDGVHLREAVVDLLVGEGRHAVLLGERRRLAGLPLTSAASSELRRAWANAGSTAT